MLYEVITVLDNVITNGLRFTLVGGEIVWTISVNEQHIIFEVKDTRITSYNVCYTKLLRLALTRFLSEKYSTRLPENSSPHCQK